MEYSKRIHWTYNVLLADLTKYVRLPEILRDHISLKNAPDYEIEYFNNSKFGSILIGRVSKLGPGGLKTFWDRNQKNSEN
jgi:hypothetical protein